MINIVVAFPKPEDTKAIKNILIKNGYDLIFIANSGAAAISLAESMSVGILISSYQFADMIYSEIRESVSKDIDMLLIASENKIDCIEAGVTFLPLPLKVYALMDAISALEEGIHKKKRKLKEKKKKRAKEEEELISKAKEILMQSKNMKEEEAHKYLQKTSMNNGCSIETVAQMIISLEK